MVDKVDIVVGLAWGDEAKGKVSNQLASRETSGEKYYDFVARWNGGSNAGHTIYIGDDCYKTHIIPCGVFHGIKSIIGPNCVLHPESFYKELDMIADAGFDTSLVRVSPNTHIVTDNHIDEDKRTLSKKLGTTSRGIAPAYSDVCGACAEGNSGNIPNILCTNENTPSIALKDGTTIESLLGTYGIECPYEGFIIGPNADYCGICWSPSCSHENHSDSICSNWNQSCCGNGFAVSPLTCECDSIELSNSPITDVYGDGSLIIGASIIDTQWCNSAQYDNLPASYGVVDDNSVPPWIDSGACNYHIDQCFVCNELYNASNPNQEHIGSYFTCNLLEY